MHLPLVLVYITKSLKMPNECLDLLVPNRAEFVNLVLNFVVTFSRWKLNLLCEEIEDIKLAVGEACANAVRYGVSSDGDCNFLAVSCLLNDHRFIIKIADNGEGFRCHRTAKKGELREYGRGIPLMIFLMDEVQFSLNGQKGTKVQLVKYI